MGLSHSFCTFYLCRCYDLFRSHMVISRYFEWFDGCSELNCSYWIIWNYSYGNESFTRENQKTKSSQFKLRGGTTLIQKDRFFVAIGAKRHVLVSISSNSIHDKINKIHRFHCCLYI